MAIWLKSDMLVGQIYGFLQESSNRKVHLKLWFVIMIIKGVMVKQAILTF